MDVKIKNADAKNVTAALHAIGRTRLPIPVAVRFAKAQRRVADELADIESTRVGLIASLTDGDKSIDEQHPRWQEFADQFTELMEMEFAAPDLFVLYERDGVGDDAEYSWMPSFKGEGPNDIEPNVLFALGGMLEIRSTNGNGAKPKLED